MNSDMAAPLFAALASKTRLDILKQLIQAGPDGLAAGKVADLLGASPSRTSFHLSALSENGLIQAKRISRSLIYTANYDIIGGLLAYLMHDCCGGRAEVISCCNNSVGRCS
ncbi:MAG: helix-turn-helix transcriptional regulator [Pseudomonadota bacterium]